jgi:hypothetical protein
MNGAAYQQPGTGHRAFAFARPSAWGWTVVIANIEVGTIVRRRTALRLLARVLRVRRGRQRHARR